MRSPDTYNNSTTVRVRVDDAPQDEVGKLVVGTHFVLHKDSHSVYRVRNHNVSEVIVTELATGATVTMKPDRTCFCVRVVSVDIVVEILR